MKPLRLLSALCLLLLAVVSGLAQEPFVLHLSPLSPGSAQLQFTRAPGYYYRLEKSTDLLSISGFSPVSGWMFGDDHLFTWQVHYTTSSPASGGGGGSGSNALSLVVIDDTHYGRVEDAQMHILHLLCYAFVERPEPVP